MNIQNKLEQIQLMVTLLDQHGWGKEYPGFTNMYHNTIDSLYKSLGEMVKVHDNLRSDADKSGIDYKSWRRSYED